MKDSCLSVVLAAGQGKRMKSSLQKVLHRLAGKALCEWVVESAAEATGTAPILVTNPDTEKFLELFGSRVIYAVQEQPLGSGHAVKCASEHLAGDGYVLIIAADMPLIRPETLKMLADKAKSERLGVCLLTALADNPAGYGRILRDKTGVLRIVEHSDATDEQKKIREVNLSVYCFNIPLLVEALSNIKNENSQNEYYLTDCIEYISRKGNPVDAVVLEESSEGLGVNDKLQLSVAAKMLRERINNNLMIDGVTLIDPQNTYIDAGVEVEQDVTIYPGVILEGSTKIKQGAVLYPGSRISDSVIGYDTVVQNSVILQSVVGNGSTIGPYAYLRPNSAVGNGCRIGDFVEVKNCNIMDGAKVSHLSYVGDGEIGENANVGCGVVFVNYDGKKKGFTAVGKNAFVGCNVNLIAPVTVGEGAYVAAGSTVTTDVEPDALCVARSRQRTIPGWAKRRREEE